MKLSIKNPEPIPPHFRNLEEAAEFWDTHDLADYEGETKEVEFEIDLPGRVFLTALEPELARKIAARAQKQGISTETLINVWLTEKLAEVSQTK